MTQQGVHRGPPAPIVYYKPRWADVERFYAKAAASGVYAPLDPGELDSMDDRLAGRIVWAEPQRFDELERYITLVTHWQVSGVLPEGILPVLAPGTYRVVENSAATGKLTVLLGANTYDLEHSWRGL